MDSSELTPEQKQEIFKRLPKHVRREAKDITRRAFSQTKIYAEAAIKDLSRQLETVTSPNKRLRIERRITELYQSLR